MGDIPIGAKIFMPFTPNYFIEQEKFDMKAGLRAEHTDVFLWL